MVIIWIILGALLLWEIQSVWYAKHWDEELFVSLAFSRKSTVRGESCELLETIVNENGVLTGHITDGIGFMQALKDNDIDVIGKKMTIAGAGGAATAIEIQAALDGVKEISIFNIHDKFWANAEETVKKINERTNCKATLYDLDDKEKLREEMADSYIFVNGTGVGMKRLIQPSLMHGYLLQHLPKCCCQLQMQDMRSQVLSKRMLHCALPVNWNV